MANRKLGVEVKVDCNIQCVMREGQRKNVTPHPRESNP